MTFLQLGFFRYRAAGWAPGESKAYGCLSPSPGQRVEREYRPANAAKGQGAEIADIGSRRQHGVALRRYRVIGAPVPDAGLHADDRKPGGFDTLAAQLAEVEGRGLVGRQQDLDSLGLDYGGRPHVNVDATRRREMAV